MVSIANFPGERHNAGRQQHVACQFRQRQRFNIFQWFCLTPSLRCWDLYNCVSLDRYGHSVGAVWETVCVLVSILFLIVEWVRLSMMNTSVRLISMNAWTDEYICPWLLLVDGNPSAWFCYMCIVALQYIVARPSHPWTVQGSPVMKLISLDLSMENTVSVRYMVTWTSLRYQVEVTHLSTPPVPSLSPPIDT